METSPSILVIILAFLDPGQLGVTLHSVKNLNTPNITILVLQNGMPDKEFNELVKLNPWITPQWNSTNLGAAGGRNRIIQYALDHSFDFVLFLDSDATLEPEAVNILLKTFPSLEKPGLASCLVRSLEKPEKIHSAGAAFQKESGVEMIHFTEVPDQAIAERPLVLTTAALIQREVLEVTPRFDESYFAYWEDVDWCLQLSAFGFQHYVIREAIAYHSTARNRYTPLVMYYFNRNQLLLFRKQGYRLGEPQIRKLIWNNLKTSIRRILGLTPLSFTVFIAIIIAYIHVMVNHYGIAPAWMRKPPERFFEYRLFNLIFRPELARK